MTSNSVDCPKKLFRFIYPTCESGTAGREEIEKLFGALQKPLKVDDRMVVKEKDSTIRDFTPEEEKQLGIGSICDDSQSEKRFWVQVESESGQEKTLYGKDESYPLRERIFTDKDEADKFAAYLKEANLPYVCFR